MTLKRLLAPLVAAALLVPLAACGSSGETSTGGGGSEEGRTVIVGTSNDAPLSYTDADGKLTGIDGDIMMAIADINGWKVETQVTDFATLIENLNTNRIDIISDGMAIKPERQEQADFGDVWYILNDAIVVPSSDTTTKGYDDLKAKTLGTVTGTLYADYIAELSGDTKLFDSQATMLTALQNGQIDAALTDAPVATYSKEQNPDLDITVVNPADPHFKFEIASAVRKGDTEIFDGINSALAEIKKNGTYQKIMDKYGMPSSSLTD